MRRSAARSGLSGRAALPFEPGGAIAMFGASPVAGVLPLDAVDAAGRPARNGPISMPASRSALAAAPAWRPAGQPSQSIRIRPFTVTATSAVLGSAGTGAAFADIATADIGRRIGCIGGIDWFSDSSWIS